ncbi:hypothetical protein FOMPIDRAFT_1053910 [Fomitopsis schrenkii]|uniref:Uncharacterized protein n=1 Tax=Fomitopsis schrenkii TaxID=2126942 RepID=S8FB05_FOMSC|nr:hypothetical protein FOMPIDRAFT_1053910 [Fomitopsis schrenkii]
MQIQMIMGTPPRLLKREIGVGGQQRRLRLRQPPLDEIILALAAKSDLHSEDIGALVEGHGDELLGHVRQHASGGGEEEFERPLLDVASTRKVLRNPEPHADSDLDFVSIAYKATQLSTHPNEIQPQSCYCIERVILDGGRRQENRHGLSSEP